MAAVAAFEVVEHTLVELITETSTGYSAGGTTCQSTKYSTGQTAYRYAYGPCKGSCHRAGL
ncbi:hypothetical protein [Kushneria sp. TE3]|uniref:hypothetical protein n=1 Tax=Kushneria sp. TE3 TaxID=3449832 RepID=UPI003F6878C5